MKQRNERLTEKARFVNESSYNHNDYDPILKRMYELLEWDGENLYLGKTYIGFIIPEFGNVFEFTKSIGKTGSNILNMPYLLFDIFMEMFINKFGSKEELKKYDTIVFYQDGLRLNEIENKYH